MRSTYDNSEKGLSLPERIRRLRRDDGGQVLILTGIMVLIAMIMTFSTINAGQMIYHRIQSQTAVDSAADTFVAFQARGLNFAQHLNDIHYWANWIIFGLESVNFGVRITCPLQAIRPPPVFFDYAYYRQCCELFKNTGKLLDDAQNTIADLILGVQSVINRAFPILAGLSANALAEANGADKVAEWIGEVTGQLTGLIGLNLSSLENLFDSVANIPGVGDIYVVPLKPGQLISLNIEEKDPDPSHLPWDTLGIIEGLVIASDIACAAAGSLAYNVKGQDREDKDGWGWRYDTYYCGGPSYNTWITGKKRRNIWPFLERLPWLNPDMSTPYEEFDIMTHQDKYPVFDHRGNVAAGSDNFRNPAFFTVASSQVGGSPLMERSSHSNFEEFAKPELISVHLGEPGSDSLTTSVMIWH